MKKKGGIIAEFKAFITRGNVLDLAVGMIIGSAFTAIVNALVNNIFKPLINAIPMGDLAGGGLITMLVAKDADGVATNIAANIDLSKSVYIDWGAFIMAIINFFLTALVLFVIVKAINTFRSGLDELKNDYGLTDDEIKTLKKQGMKRDEIKAYAEKKAADEAAKKAEEEAKAKEEAAKNAPETTEAILAEIRELLKAQAATKTK